MLAAAASGVPREELTVEGLKARISSAQVGDKPHLCLQVAQLQLAAADKLYSAGDMDKAQADLTDVVAYSELARDYSIQSHKYQKQAEISVRTMTRKLTEILHTLGQGDQAAVKDAVKRLDHVRDDLLASMFKKGAK
jgi:ferredoxin-NADP reductase